MTKPCEKQFADYQEMRLHYTKVASCIRKYSRRLIRLGYRFDGKLNVFYSLHNPIYISLNTIIKKCDFIVSSAGLIKWK